MSGRAQRSFPATMQRFSRLRRRNLSMNADLPHDTPKSGRDISDSFSRGPVKFQEDFRRGVLSVFRVAKESTADLEDVRIVSGMN
jgi:hypothetical protein